MWDMTLIRLRIAIAGDPLWMRHWTWGFHIWSSRGLTITEFALQEVTEWVRMFVVYSERMIKTSPHVWLAVRPLAEEQVPACVNVTWGPPINHIPCLHISTAQATDVLINVLHVMQQPNICRGHESKDPDSSPGINYMVWEIWRFNAAFTRQQTSSLMYYM